MADLSRSEYLKRYLSNKDIPKEDRRKKKKKTQSSKHSKLKIIDDDYDLKHSKKDRSAYDELNEDKPTVAEFIDERPKHVQQLEEYRKNSRWKILGDDKDETSQLDYGVIQSRSTELEGPECSRMFVPNRKRHDTSDSDSSQDRLKSGSNKIKNRVSKRQDSSSDDSSVRRNTNTKINKSVDSNSDNSPPRKKSASAQIHRKSDSDASPPRRSNTRLDKSPSKKASYDHMNSDSDASPPRKNRAQNQYAKSAPSKSQKPGRAGSESDNSPPRRQSKRHDSRSSSSPSPRLRNKSDSDQSPPRRSAADFDTSQSPPRKGRHDSGSSDQSPPRKRNKNLSKSGSDSQDGKTGSGRSRKDKDQHGKKQDKATKTLAGAKAGLSSAREMREEAKKLREKEDLSFRNISDEKLGRNSKTVVRDKETGKRRDLKAEHARNEEEAKQLEEQKEKYKQWGKGLKQQAMMDARLQDQATEALKPLARFQDDKHLDEMLRKEERIEDPMLKFIKKKKEKESQKSGKSKQKELPKYTGPAPPPNRYNIQPGYRWDGVDRSNGFEKKVFAATANKKATQEMAYKWSTEDM